MRAYCKSGAAYRRCSAPYFGSLRYAGPSVVNQNATVRALGYSADFQQSEEADEISVIVLERHTLNTGTAGGGTVVLSLVPGSPVSTNVFFSTNTVLATAVPAQVLFRCRRGV
jgi:hypothetical protein